MQKITYYKLPIGNIPFKQIPSLEKFDFEYVYCSSVPLSKFMKSDFQLVSVYNCFTKAAIDISDFQDQELLFGRVVSDKFYTRGVAKAIKLRADSIVLNKEDLPHLKYNSKGDDSIEGNWFYVKDGNYVLFSGIKSQYEKVKHLEGMALHGDIIIRLRIIIELLKKNIKQGLISWNNVDFRNVAFAILRNDPTTIKVDDDAIWNGINNWLPGMLSMPLYEDIPRDKRERMG